MHDTIAQKPDMADLYQIAIGQQGYFTSRQAYESGMSKDLVKHYVRTGRFTRVYRGVYRFRDYPPSPREHVAAAWLAVGKDHAVVSHESALDLIDLTDVIPFGIHLTVPRTARYARKVPGVVLHTTTKAFDPEHIQIIDGIRVASVERTIVDVAAAGLSPEHVEIAVVEALKRGMSSEDRIRTAAAKSSRRVRIMIEQAIEVAA